MLRGLLIAAAFVAGCFCTSAWADTGALAFARQLHFEGGLRHDRGFVGPEVVYRSSWKATKADAIQGWLRSRIGHRELYLAGKITDIQCYGNVCVGRGQGAVTSSTSRTRTTVATRSRWFRR